MQRRTLIGALALLGGCIGQPPAPPAEGTEAGTNTSGVTATTDGGSTSLPATGSATSSSGPGTQTSATTDGSGSSSTDGPADTGSSSSGAPRECMVPEDCGSNETCSAGQCESVCSAGWGQGTWDYCLNALGDFDTANACGGPFPDHACLNFGNPIEAVVCSTQGCTDACGCPEPPATGTATVACGSVTGDGTNDCYLSCENGETCPDGMTCRNGLLCVHTPLDLPMYGNCEAVASSCAVGQCLQLVATGHSMCVESCNDAGDCDPSPPGSANAAACGNVMSTPQGSECYIPCANDNHCPFTMECVNGTMCMWPP